MGEKNVDKKASAMRWTAEHDLTLLKEMLLQEPYKYKHGSPERGQVWDIMSQTLNYMEDLYFKVSQRSVRDRFKTISDNFKRRIREEESASGITPDYTELDQALHDVIERFKVADEDHKNLSASKKAKIDEEVEKASEMRKRSLETFKETNDRLENSDDGECGTKMTPNADSNAAAIQRNYETAKGAIHCHDAGSTIIIVKIAGKKRLTFPYKHVLHLHKHFLLAVDI